MMGEMISAREAARRCGVSVRTILNSPVKRTRLGERVLRFKASDIEQWLAENEYQPQHQKAAAQ